MTDPNCRYNDGEHCRKGLPGTLCEVEVKAVPSTAPPYCFIPANQAWRAKRMMPLGQ